MSSVIVQRQAQWLGNLGLLPFFALALATWLPVAPPHTGLPAWLLVGYAAVILSFLGAVHWGFALLTPGLTRAQARQALLWSVVPSLLGWLALALALGGLPPAVVLLLLIADFVLCRLMDGALLRVFTTAPAWYLPLRTRLTVGACLALALALAGSL
jgi:hypothetical protein